MTKILGIAGAETKAACSKAEALEAAPAFRPDVVLSDVAKPVEPVMLLATVARLAQPRGM